MFVVADRQAMQDTGDVDGLTAKRLRILEKAQEENSMFAVGVPISTIADYDLAKYRLSLKKEFDMVKVLEKASGNSSQYRVDMLPLLTLAHNISDNKLLMD